MENQPTKLDRAVKISIVAGVLLIASAFVYGFAYIPYKKSSNLDNCLENSNDVLNQKRNKITSYRNELEQNKSIVKKTADDQLTEFFKNNPEPNEDSAALIAHYEWDSKRDSFYDPVRNIEKQLRDIGSDFEKAEIDKKSRDEQCYKRYK